MAMANVMPSQLQLQISKLVTRIAFPDIRGCAPSLDKVKNHAWTLRAMYKRADWRDANIMLAREKIPARGPVAKTIALELKRRDR